MQKTSGLGRGLGSLIPNKKPAVTLGDDYQYTNSAVKTQEAIVELPVDKIHPNPYQPRHDFSAEQLDDLVNSIKEHGIIQPLIVTKAVDGWQLIAGERRWRSAKVLNLPTVPAIVRDLADQKKFEIALIENLQRQDLNALEVAEAYRRLIDEFNLTQDALAKRVGKSRPAVANTLRLLNVAEEVKVAIRSGEITEGHARVLSGLPKEDQLELLKRITVSGMNVRDTEKAGKQIVVNKHIRRVNVDIELKAKEEELTRRLGTKVEIKKSGGSGQIVIKFFSEDEFNDLMTKIG